MAGTGRQMSFIFKHLQELEKWTRVISGLLGSRLLQTHMEKGFLVDYVNNDLHRPISNSTAPAAAKGEATRQADAQNSPSSESSWP